MTITRLAVGAATLSFEDTEGGRLSLSLDGRELLQGSAALHVVADGTRYEGWIAPQAELRGGALVVDGEIGSGVAAQLAISTPSAGDATFEFALTLSNRGYKPVRISEADAFAGRLVAGAWQGLSFTSKWGEEFEPAPFTVEGEREIDCRSGRSSLGHNPFLGLSSSLGALALAPVWSGNWHIKLSPSAGGVDVRAGISPWRFWADLAPGQVFEAPSVLVAVGTDLDAATLALTRAVGATLPRSAVSEEVPLEWNHWWPYEDKEINEEVFLANAALASELGFMVSSLDAGWFGAADTDTFWWDIRGDFG